MKQRLRLMNKNICSMQYCSFCTKQSIGCCYNKYYCIDHKILHDQIHKIGTVYLINKEENYTENIPYCDEWISSDKVEYNVSSYVMQNEINVFINMFECFYNNAKLDIECEECTSKSAYVCHECMSYFCISCGSMHVTNSACIKN